MAVGFSIYLYGRVSLLVPECAGYLCIYVCVISNQITTKKRHVSDLSKLDTLLHKTKESRTGTKVPRLDIYRSIKPLSEITQQMWHNHPPIPSKKQDIKNIIGGVGSGQGAGEVGQNFKKLG